MSVESLIAIAVFTLTITLLSGIVTVARQFLVPHGLTSVTVNGAPMMLANGANLLQALREQAVLIPAACGGRSLCGQCKLTVVDSAPPALPIERGHLSTQEQGAGVRLACAHRVEPGLSIRVATDYLTVTQLTCEVVRSRYVSALMREIRLRLPHRDALRFTPGQYVMVTAPAYSLDFADMSVDEQFLPFWREQHLFRLHSGSAEVSQRAYSLSDAPGDGSEIELLVRLALPPPSKSAKLPPGIVSSYLFGVGPGDSVSVAGPYGEFRLSGSARDKVFIAGGAGMAPMRAMLKEELTHPTSACQLTFFYGARNLRDLCYRQEFDDLAESESRFNWQVALSDPIEPSDWSGATGFIHNLLRIELLERHPSPEALEFYICGPPLMSAATLDLLDDYGVDPAQIFYDRFGA